MLRNLREKLEAIDKTPPATKPIEPPSAQQSSPIGRYYRCVCPAPDLNIWNREAVNAMFRVELTQWDQEKLLFMDTETTGLSGGAGTLAFLIGVGFYEGDSLVVEQYFMRDYDEETDILERFRQRLESRSCIVSFNGKSFDMPILQSRSILNRIRQPMEAVQHIDIMHCCRRLYKRRMESCSLSAIESSILDISRGEDIPGSEIPALFFSCLESGEYERMDLVIQHNRSDITTMAWMMQALMEAYDDPLSLQYPEDIYSCGVILQKLGDARFVDCYEAAAQQLPDAKYALAGHYKRMGRMQEAAQLWQQMIADGQGGSGPYVELAKYAEHTLKNTKDALMWTELCMSRMRPLRAAETLQSLSVRRERLMKRLRKG